MNAPIDESDRATPLSYELPGVEKSRPPSTMALVVGSLIFGTLVAIAFMILLTSMNSPRVGRTYVVPCPSNLKNIGLACLTYANNYGGNFPNRIEDLILIEELKPDKFVCPSSRDSPATGTPAEQAAAISAGGHCSYVYVGKGFTLTMCDPGGFAAGRSMSAVVLAHENPANHKVGMNVLFVDGHVQFVAATSVAQLFAMYPPPAVPTTMPATNPG